MPRVKYAKGNPVLILTAVNIISLQSLRLRAFALNLNSLMSKPI